MGKLVIIIFLLTGALFKTNAQVSDADARLQYQQITDAYEATDYYNAAQLSNDLKNKMGNWTPKVLYIYLRSAYKNYTETQQSGTGRFGTDSTALITFVNLCDTFFSTVNKAEYPSDKYGQIQETQHYFTEQYQKSKGRSPQDAINFIVKISRAFPAKMLSSRYIDSMSLEETKLTIWIRSVDYQDIHVRYRMNLPKVYWEGKYNDIRDDLLPRDKGDIISASSGFNYSNDERFSITEFYDCFELKDIYNKAAEFKKNNYPQRIYDAFDFLIKWTKKWAEATEENRQLQARKVVAQNNDRTPQEAIDLIVKTSKQYPSAKAGKMHIDSMEFDGKILTLYKSFEHARNYKGGTEVYKTDLSKVSWKYVVHDHNTSYLGGASDDNDFVTKIKWKNEGDDTWAWQGRMACGTGIDINTYFDITSQGYKDGHYEQKIRDAFDFLVSWAIVHTENKQADTDKF